MDRSSVSGFSGGDMDQGEEREGVPEETKVLVQGVG